MINSRILQITDILLKKDQYITIDNVSKELQVSNKTIRNDLKLVDEWLQEYNLKLIKKTGVGIHIEGSKEAKLNIMDILEEKNSELIDYSPEARKIYIGMRLLATNENCRIYELSDELYVSRATIHKDILSLAPLLQSHKIQLIRKNNNGISIQGTEKNKRNFLLKLLMSDNGYLMFTNIVKYPQYENDGSIAFAGLDLVDDELLEFVNVIRKAKSDYVQSLTFDSLVQVLLHAYVVLLRVSQKQFIELSDEFLLELKNEPYFVETKQICDCMSAYYHMDIPEVEVRYLQVFLISLRNSARPFELDEKEADELRNRILASLCEQLALPFSDDQELKNALFAHLCPAITRYRHAIPLENPLKHEISKLYKNSYQITKKSIACIEEAYHCQLSEDEICYFTLHVVAALERMKKPLSTLLVCHGGAGVSNLLVHKLSAQISEIDIVKIETLLSINDYPMEGIELIITTTQLHIDTTIPILTINPLLYDYDIHRLKDVIKEYFNKKNDPLRKVIQL